MIKSFSLSQKQSWIPVALFLLLATAAVTAYSWHSTGFLPIIHDERAYLLQTQTFLLGRLTNPTHPEKLFFDQFHVINEGVFASKYFPGLAITLMPFVALGLPYANPILFFTAQLLLIFLIAKELFGIKTAWVSMVLAALSPQMVLQTCFILSHVPNAVFLLLFFYGIIKILKGNFNWAIPASLAFGMSFLIRPMTSVAFALPVGIYYLIKILKKETPLTLKIFLSWVIPALLCLLFYFSYNKAVTGSFTENTFDYYAKIHAPFHRYGFDTWTRYAEEAQGPRVDKVFNEYYHNHTFKTGILMAGLRLGFLIKFLAGFTFFGFIALVIFIWQLRARNPWELLIFAIVLSLQIFYIPHFYPGILTFGSNYLYEASGLLWIAIAHGLLVLLEKIPKLALRRGILTFMMFFFILPSLWSLREMAAQTLTINFRQPIIWLRAQLKNIPKSLVIVRYLPDYNRNWDCMDNRPDLSGAIVYARDRGPENRKLIPYFPGRLILVWDFAQATLIPLDKDPGSLPKT